MRREIDAIIVINGQYCSGQLYFGESNIDIDVSGVIYTVPIDWASVKCSVFPREVTLESGVSTQRALYQLSDDYESEIDFIDITYDYNTSQQVILQLIEKKQKTSISLLHTHEIEKRNSNSKIEEDRENDLRLEAKIRAMLARQEEERQEAEARRLEEERKEREWQETEARRLEEERKERERKEAEVRRLEEERKERERQEAEARRLEEERKEKEHLEAEARRLEEERKEKERLEAEARRIEEERKEKERQEAEARRIEEERKERARLEAEARRLEEERKEKERQEAEARRIEEERKEKERQEAEARRIEEERKEKERQEAEARRIEEERKEKERQEAEARRLDEERREDKAGLSLEKKSSSNNDYISQMMLREEALLKEKELDCEHKKEQFNQWKEECVRILSRNRINIDVLNNGNCITNDPDAEQSGNPKLDAVVVKMMSKDRVLELSHGEVTKAETINYRTMKGVPGGLFAEEIFGPEKNFTCACKKYRSDRDTGIVCEKCNTRVTSTFVRRSWMGHIELYCNAVLPQYLQGNPSILATLLDLPQSILNEILFANFEIDAINYWDYDNKLKSIDLSKNSSQYGIDAVRQILMDMDLTKELAVVENKLEHCEGYSALHLYHRKEVIEAFLNSHNKPHFMIVSRILVLPANLRPFVVKKDRIAISRLNDSYLLILRRVNLLRRLKEIAPDILVLTQMRMIQSAINLLFDCNSFSESGLDDDRTSLIERCNKATIKRSDYSAEGAALCDPDIPIDRIGLPMSAAMNLFKPFINNARRIIGGISSASTKDKFYEYYNLDVRNDGISLYKFSKCNDLVIEAVENAVVLVHSRDGRVIALKPQIAAPDVFLLNPYIYSFLGLSESQNRIDISVQLSDKARKEAIRKFGVESQIYSSVNDSFQIAPSELSQGWLAALTQIGDGKKHVFVSRGEAFCAYYNDFLAINDPLIIKCRTDYGFDYVEETSLGRIIVNEIIPQNIGVVNRSYIKNRPLLEINFELHSEDIHFILRYIYFILGSAEYIRVLNAWSKRERQYLLKSCGEVAVLASEAKKEQSTPLKFFKNSRIERIKDSLENKSLPEISLLRSISREIKLIEREPVETIFDLSQFDKDFWKYFLEGRISAESIAHYNNQIVERGDTISLESIEELFKVGISGIRILDDQFTEDGTYSICTIGTIYRNTTPMAAALSIAQMLKKIQYNDAKIILALLVNITCIELSPKLIELIEEKIIQDSSAFEISGSNLIIIDFDSTIVLLMKHYLISYLVHSNNEKINSIFVDLLLKASVKYSAEETPLKAVFSQNSLIKLDTVAQIPILEERIDISDKAISLVHGIDKNTVDSYASDDNSSDNYGDLSGNTDIRKYSREEKAKKTNRPSQTKPDQIRKGKEPSHATTNLDFQMQAEDTIKIREENVHDFLLWLRERGVDENKRLELEAQLYSNMRNDERSGIHNMVDFVDKNEVRRYLIKNESKANKELFHFYWTYLIAKKK